MSSYTIERQIEIDAPVDVVWRTITDPELIPTWFADVADVEPQPGAAGSLTFGAGTDAPQVVPIMVVAADRPHLFSYRWSHGADEPATTRNSTLVTFTLAAAGEERTRLRVVESGLDEMDMSDEDKQAFADDHRHGWQVQGDRLRDRFATGQAASR